ncbi:MAG: cell division protein FtsQ/DivIB [Draconibacterium sp.]
MFKKLWKIGGALLVVLFMVITLAFTSMKYSGVACKSVQVEYEPDDKITLNKDVILRAVKKADKDIIGKTFDQIDAEKLEAAVEKQAAVFKSEVYKTVAKDSSSFAGILTVRVKHREPVVRVITSTTSYYLDEFAHRFPVSSTYPAQVLVATGSIDTAFAKEQLLPCVLFITGDEFWNAQIEQIYVEPNGDLVLTPLMGDHLIELGSPENLQEKFRNMKAFYKQVLANRNWNKYETISLKYKNQVIAKRR